MAEINSKQYIEVRLGKDLYGIEIKYIDNIIIMHNITRVPKAQPYFLGVINLRGEIIPVMSLRRKIGLEDDEFTSSTRIMIVKPELHASPIGIIVDEVNEVVTLDNDDIDMLIYDDKDSKAGFSAGIGKIDNDLVNILNIPNIVFDKDE
jgi:purine-binding chemotaxis protein CheW